MSKLKHTQGPWVIVPDDDYTMIEANEYSERICDLQNSNKRSEANAKLIAAAPELLEALQLAYELIPRPALDQLGAAEAAANLAWIKRIINKAEGEE